MRRPPRSIAGLNPPLAGASAGGLSTDWEGGPTLRRPPLIAAGLNPAPRGLGPEGGAASAETDCGAPTLRRPPRMAEGSKPPNRLMPPAGGLRAEEGAGADSSSSPSGPASTSSLGKSKRKRPFFGLSRDRSAAEGFCFVTRNGCEMRVLV